MSTRSTSQSERSKSRTESTQPARSTGSRTGNINRRRRSNRPEKGGFQVFLELIFLTFFGRVLLVSLVMMAVIGLNLLISKNQFDRFFIMTGIELVLLGLFLWLKMMLKKPESSD